MAKDQLLTELSKIEALPDFEGSPTLATSLEVRGIEGGFNDGLTIDPVVLHKGDEVYLLVHGVVDSINHPPVKDTNGVRRSHVVRVRTGTLVDAEFAESRLEALALRIEGARGIARLPWDGDDEDLGVSEDDEDSDEAAYARNHAAGNHADGLVDGCPSCDAELDALAAEGVVE